jgi:hypothetical protein
MHMPARETRLCLNMPSRILWNSRDAFMLREEVVFPVTRLNRRSSLRRRRWCHRRRLRCDAFSTSYDEVALCGNVTINWDATCMFSQRALGEMTLVSKSLAKGLHGSPNDKIYTYFEGCSDGGREGMNQVQRWPQVYLMSLPRVRSTT